MSSTSDAGHFGTDLIKPSLWPGLAMPVLLTVINGYHAVVSDWYALRSGPPAAAYVRLLVGNGLELLLLAVLLWLYATSYRVKITDAGVESRDFFGRRHRVAWENVLRIENSGNIRLASAKDTVIIREIGFMSKWQRLSDILAQRLPWTVWPLPTAVQRRQTEPPQLLP
jgi:hypothetical protein